MVQQRSRRTRIADVAREAGVSKTAVSFAFNNPERLSSDTATRIREVASALGYRPHPVARMLTQQRTGIVGVLTPQALSVVFANPFFSAFSQGFAGAAEEASYSLLFVSPLDGSLEGAVDRATVDGLAIVGLSEEHPEVEHVLQADLPIVMVDSSAFPEHSSVEVDDESGARAAADHLLGLGHREFLVVGAEPPMPGSRAPFDGIVGRRLAGYRTALAAAGIDLPDDRVVVGPATVEGGTECFLRAWEDGLRPTAVLAMSDAMAIGVLAGAHRLGLPVPDDLSVVGFDDIDVARLVDPPLTTVHQPVRRKGEEACRLLLAAIERNGESRPQHRRLDTRLIVRGSSGRAPQPRQEVAAEE
ncbi:MAG: LacI family transcriptional regulator [Chloroflexi bacterium]|nr:LacI family transcriptional regulator [Chloroflexota bacterium]